MRLFKEYVIENEISKGIKISDQLKCFSEYILTSRGDHVVSTSEIIKNIKEVFGTNSGLIHPPDFCYNRINKSVNVDGSCYFEYLDHNNLIVLGVDYKYNGTIYAKPHNKKEHIAGKCIQGKRHIGYVAYPDEITEKEYVEGTKREVTINIYKRNLRARQECICIHDAVFVGLIYQRYMEMNLLDVYMCII